MDPKVILVRHGHTKLNNTSDKSEDRIRGWTDVPLDERGIKDAEKVSKKLNKKYEIDCIYSSDLSRAMDTAKICNIHDLPIEKTKALRPWNLGDIQGQKTEEVLPEMTRLIKKGNEAPKNGETFNAFKERFLDKLIEIVDEANEYGYQTAVFTHFRDLKCADAWIAAGAPDNFKIDIDTMLEDDFNPGALFELPLDEMS